MESAFLPQARVSSNAGMDITKVSQSSLEAAQCPWEQLSTSGEWESMNNVPASPPLTGQFRSGVSVDPQRNSSGTGTEMSTEQPAVSLPLLAFPPSQSHSPAPSLQLPETTSQTTRTQALSQSLIWGIHRDP